MNMNIKALVVAAALGIGSGQVLGLEPIDEFSASPAPVMKTGYRYDQSGDSHLFLFGTSSTGRSVEIPLSKEADSKGQEIDEGLNKLCFFEKKGEIVSKKFYMIGERDPMSLKKLFTKMKEAQGGKSFTSKPISFLEKYFYNHEIIRIQEFLNNNGDVPMDPRDAMKLLFAVGNGSLSKDLYLNPDRNGYIVDSDIKWNGQNHFLIGSRTEFLEEPSPIVSSATGKKSRKNKAHRSQKIKAAREKKREARVARMMRINQA